MILAIITLHNRQRNTTFSNTHPYTEHASKTFLFFYTRSSHLAYKLSVVAIGPRKNDIYATIHFLTPTFFTLRSRRTRLLFTKICSAVLVYLTSYESCMYLRTVLSQTMAFVWKYTHIFLIKTVLCVRLLVIERCT